MKRNTVLSGCILLCFLLSQAVAETKQDLQLNQLKLLAEKAFNNNTRLDSTKVYLVSDLLKNKLTPIPDLQWLPCTNNCPDSQGEYATVCRATFADEQAINTMASYPGQLSKMGCKITFGKFILNLTNYAILSGTNKGLVWISKTFSFPEPNGMTPMQRGREIYDQWQSRLKMNMHGAMPVAGGYGQKAPILICRTKYKGRTVIGRVTFEMHFEEPKAIQDFCQIAVGEASTRVPNDYDILCWKRE